MEQSNIQFIVAMKFKNLGASTLPNELCNFLRECRKEFVGKPTCIEKTRLRMCILVFSMCVSKLVVYGK